MFNCKQVGNVIFVFWLTKTNDLGNELGNVIDSVGLGIKTEDFARLVSLPKCELRFFPLKKSIKCIAFFYSFLFKNID